MILDKLENLVKIRQLKKEPPDQAEFDGMIEAGARQLTDAEVDILSNESRFILAYGASHAFALAALRWHGYRSENRYIVFQCLQHTLSLANTKWRILDKCHKQRNLSEYEGHLEFDERLFGELMDITKELQSKVILLPPIR